jgi:hypothetical protein
LNLFCAFDIIEQINPPNFPALHEKSAYRLPVGRQGSKEWEL